MAASIQRQVQLIYTTPGAETTRRQIEGLGEAANQTAQRIAAAGPTAAAGFKRITAEAINASVGVERAAKSASASFGAFEAGVGRLEQNFRGLRNSVDPAARALEQYRRAQETARLAVSYGVASQEEANRVLALAAQRYQQSTATVVQESGRAAIGTRAMGAAVQQAGFQVGDFAVQVASGQSALVAFTQQGAQLLGFFGPFGAVLGAGVAILGALALGFTRAGDSSSDAVDALEEYNRVVALAGNLSEEAAGKTDRLAGSMRNAGVAALEKSLQQAVVAQQELRPQIEFQQQNIAVLRNVPSRLPELQAAEAELATLIERYDQYTAAIDGINAELAVLRDTLPGVTKETERAAGVTTKHASAIDAALERLERQVVANDNAILTYGREEEALARVQAEQAILNAARDDGVQLTDAQRERMELLLAQYEETEERLRSLRERTRQQQEAERDAARAAEETARAREKAARDAQREYERVIDNIADFGERALGDSFYDVLRGETVDFAEFLETTLLRALANIAASAAANAIIVPIATQVVGAVPGLFGLSGQGAATAQQAAGGGLGAASNLLSIGSGVNSIFGGGASALATSFATSSFGTAIGLSAPTAFSAGVAPVVGGLSNAAAAGTGGALSLTTAGSALAGAAPFIAAGVLALSLLAGSGLFGGSPSVGPTGVARLPAVIGDSRIALSTDNGGSPDQAESVAQSIRDISTSAAKTLGAFGSRNFGLDVGSFPSPEKGSGQKAGFNLKEIVDGVLADDDFAKGLTADEAVTEGVRRTLQKAFDGFPVEEVSTALSKSAADTVEELLADLDFANLIGTYVDKGFAGAQELTRPLTAVEQAFKDLATAAEEGEKKARELGISVQATAAYFADLEDELVAQTQESFTRRLREARGEGVYNAIDDLITQRGVDARDATAAGLDVNATAGTLFDASLRATLGNAGLNDLGRILASGEVEDAQAQGVIQALINERALAAAREVEAAAMQTQIEGLADLATEAERFADAAGENARALRQAAAGLLVDQDLSPLSAYERLQEARRQFDTAVSAANDADPTDEESQRAIQELPGLSTVLLQLSRDYFASSEEYQAEFARVQAALSTTAQRQEDIEEQQLSALRDIEQRIVELGGSLSAASGALYVKGSDGQYISTGAGGLPAGLDLGYDAERNIKIYRAYQLAGATYRGAGEGQIGQDRAGNAGLAAILKQLGFAEGGVVAGGIPGRDSVPAVLMPGERVLSVEQNRIFDRLAANDVGGMRQLQAEIRGLRRENAELLRQLAQVTATVGLRVAGAVERGSDAERRMAAAAERAGARPQGAAA